MNPWRQVLRAMIPLAVILLSATACTQAITNTENALTRAGFKFQPADTPQRQAALRSLQPHRFSMQVRNNKAIWVYADPTICHCLYLGDQFAYDTYIARVREQQRLDYDKIVAMNNANNALPYPFRWDDWGPGTPHY
jgi:hypothetical protein